MESYDIAVVGAGPAGICAALQAARGGAKTLLVEKNGIPGGAIVSAGVPVPGLFDACGRQVIDGIAWELVGKTLDANGDARPDFSRTMTEAPYHYQIKINPFLFAAISEEAMSLAKVEMRYHTMPAKAERLDDSWLLLLCEKDGLYPVEAKMLIDCTGDANLTKIAGYEVREPRICQPGSESVSLTGYKLEDLDTAELAEAFAAAEKNKAIRWMDLGYFSEPAREGRFLLLERNGLNGNHICGINAADSRRKTQMELEARRSVLRAFRFLKGRKGLERLSIEMIAPECGVRESRTVAGEYTMTAEDYLSGRPFPDSLCYSFYPLDLHDAERGLILRDLPEGILPQVPRNILIPRNSKGFLVAGRIVSSSREANAALRIQATCMATGQAAAASALCAMEDKCDPGKVSPEKVRTVLKRHHAIVPG